MLRLGSIILVLSVFLGTASSAKAQWFDKFCTNFKRDYHRNKMWPEPFLQADRQATMAPFAIQTANGWRRQNLISDYHFQEGTHQLTLAGESKVRFILTQMPPNRRIIFVQQAFAPEETQARIQAVERASSRMVPQGMVAQIVESNLPNDGWPADDVDAVTRKYNSSRPDPRLPAASESSEGTTSGSNGGQ
jgi:hypothetical protein